MVKYVEEEFSRCLSGYIKVFEPFKNKFESTGYLSTEIPINFWTNSRLTASFLQNKLSKAKVKSNRK